MPEAPEEVVRLAEERAAARASKEFAMADTLRDRIADSGWTVVDEPGGFRLERESVVADPRVRGRAGDIASVLGDEPDMDVSVEWVCEGWHEDIERAMAGFRANEEGRSVQYVIADVTDREPSTWGDGVEVVWLEEGTGWACAARSGS